MSVCVVSDTEESGEMRVEDLLIETKSFTECDFEAPDEDELEKHHDDDAHTKKTSLAKML